MNCHRLDDGAESFVVVHTGALGVPANNPARLAPGEGVVGVEFIFEDPFAGDNVGVGWRRHEAPGTVVDESTLLVLHGSTPERISQGTAVVGWDRVEDGGGHVAVVDRLNDTVRQLRAHRVPLRWRWRRRQ
jgi:hypothetical protein